MKTIKHLRTQKGLNQQKLADIIGVSRSTVAMWENGLSQPDNDSLKRLSLALDCTTDYLLGRSDTEMISPHLDFTKFFSPAELDLIKAYRAHPEMHEAVQRLLGMDEKQAPADKHDYRLVAFGGDNVNKDDTEPRIT